MLTQRYQDHKHVACFLKSAENQSKAQSFALHGAAEVVGSVMPETLRVSDRHVPSRVLSYSIHSIHKDPINCIECQATSSIWLQPAPCLWVVQQVGLLQRPLTDDMDHEGRARAVQLLSQVW